MALPSCGDFKTRARARTFRAVQQPGGNLVACTRSCVQLFAITANCMNHRDTQTQSFRVLVSLWFVSLFRDVLYAFRMMRREPGFTLIAIITLALGIGATTSIFTVVDGVLLRRAPLAGMERLMVLWETDRHSSTTREPASVPDYLDFSASAKSFDRVSAIAGREVNLNPAA